MTCLSWSPLSIVRTPCRRADASICRKRKIEHFLLWAKSAILDEIIQLRSLIHIVRKGFSTASQSIRMRLQSSVQACTKPESISYLAKMMLSMRFSSCSWPLLSVFVLPGFYNKSQIADQGCPFGRVARKWQNRAISGYVIPQQYSFRSNTRNPNPLPTGFRFGFLVYGGA